MANDQTVTMPTLMEDAIQHLPQEAQTFVRTKFDETDRYYERMKTSLLRSSVMYDYTEAMRQNMWRYMNILNLIVSARIQLIIAVDVRKAVQDNGWNDEVRSHVVEVVYKIREYFTVNPFAVIPEE